MKCIVILLVLVGAAIVSSATLPSIDTIRPEGLDASRNVDMAALQRHKRTHGYHSIRPYGGFKLRRRPGLSYLHHGGVSHHKLVVHKLKPHKHVKLHKSTLHFYHG